MIDEWTFSGTAGQRVFVDFQQFSGNATLNARLSNTSVIVDSWAQSGLNTLDRGPLVLPATDTYTLRISPNLNVPDTFTYRFKLWDVPEPDVEIVQVGDVVNGEIESPGVMDEWKFSGSAGQKIYVDFQQFSGNANLNAQTLEVRQRHRG